MITIIVQVHTSSNPIYPKKDDVAPLKIPTTPNCGGMNGVRFSFGLINIKPTPVIKTTSATFVIVKKLVTFA